MAIKPSALETATELENERVGRLTEEVFFEHCERLVDSAYTSAEIAYAASLRRLMHDNRGKAAALNGMTYLVDRLKELTERNGELEQELRRVKTGTSSGTGLGSGGAAAAA